MAQRTQKHEHETGKQKPRPMIPSSSYAVVCSKRNHKERIITIGLTWDRAKRIAEWLDDRHKERHPNSSCWTRRHYYPHAYPSQYLPSAEFPLEQEQPVANPCKSCGSECNPETGECEECTENLAQIRTAHQHEVMASMGEKDWPF